MFLFIAYLHKYIVFIINTINQSVLAIQAPKSLQCLPNYVLQTLVNNSINMIKQLYYSKIHLKNIEIYLSKLYLGTYCEVHDVIKYMQKSLSVNKY